MDTQAWQRLAVMLAERRASLRPEWQERTAFAADTGLSYRSISDLEGVRRDNYRASWLAMVESAYEWEPGSIREVLAGGDPTPKEAGTARDLVAGSPTEWEGTLTGPSGPLEEGEVLMWRTDERGTAYRLYLPEERISVEHVFPASEPREQVIEDLRELMEPHRVQVQQLERRRARR